MKVAGSNQIKDITYEPKGGMLVVQFHYQDRIYTYANVPPEVHKEFMNSSSKGKFFHAIIKRNYHHLRIT